jgi:hypothetical protein
MPGKTKNNMQREGAARKRQAVKPVSQERLLLREQHPPLTMEVQRAMLDPGQAKPGDILALQRLAGNQAVSHLLQAKLMVGPPGDRYEQEADRVAEQVMGMPGRSPAGRSQSSTAQRQEDAGGIQARPLAASITRLLQRQEEEEELQAKPLVQRQEEEEEVQTKPLLQRQAEEEEELQTKPLPSAALRTGVQRQEDEEELQTKPLLQRQAEEEEELQTKPVLQRQEEEEEIQTKPLLQRQEEEEIQTKPLLQRQEEEEELQTKPILQRQAEEEEELQTKPLPSAALPTAARGPGRTGVQRRGGGGFEAGSRLESRLATDKGGGSPLPDDVRAFMEPRFGADFGGVRVHTGGEAVQLTQDLKAQAFTHGQDIYLGAGRYDPGSAAGKRLLAHELTHVVQQTGGQVQRKTEGHVQVSAAPANALQRLMTRKQLEARGGKVSKRARILGRIRHMGRSTYHKILMGLESYSKLLKKEAKEQGKGQKPNYSAQKIKILQKLWDNATKWLGSHESPGKRNTALKGLLKEIGVEMTTVSIAAQPEDIAKTMDKKKQSMVDKMLKELTSGDVSSIAKGAETTLIRYLDAYKRLKAIVGDFDNTTPKDEATRVAKYINALIQKLVAMTGMLADPEQKETYHKSLANSLSTNLQKGTVEHNPFSVYEYAGLDATYLNKSIGEVRSEVERMRELAEKGIKQGDKTSKDAFFTKLEKVGGLSQSDKGKIESEPDSFGMRLREARSVLMYPESREIYHAFLDGPTGLQKYQELSGYKTQLSDLNNAFIMLRSDVVMKTGVNVPLES